MLFCAMNQEEITRVVGFLFGKEEKGILMITLIDGNTICGFLPSRGYLINQGRYKKPEDCCYKENKLILEIGSEWSFFVPFTEIAGISALFYSQKDYSIPRSSLWFDVEHGHEKLPDEKTELKRLVDEGIFFTKVSFWETLEKDIIAKCKRYHFHIEFHFCNYCKGDFDTIAWGELIPESKSRLYTDWDYLSHMSGGVTSIGVGVVGISGSISWDNSLVGVRKRLMKKKTVSFEKIKVSDKKPVVITAYIDTLRLKKNKKKEIHSVRLEGAKWFPVLLYEENMFEYKNLEPNKWCVGYMKKECIEGTKEAFDFIRKPLRIQGEVIPFSIETLFGNCKYAIKIRNISSL